MARETIGSVAVEVVPDLKGFQQQTGRAASKAGTDAGTTFAKGFGGKFKAGFSQAMAEAKRDFAGNLGKGFVQGLGIAGALNAANLVTKAIGGAVDMMGDAINAASDLNESMSKVNVVFGDSAREIVDWSETSAESVLMSQQAALEAVGTFGNLFDALGLASKAQVDMSKGAVQLAADLASFNNASTEDTLLAIRSGLLGEAEPMRKFGSALSAARVETFALSKGWVKNKKDLTEAMKVQARYELMLQDTVNAQGDVARTSEGMANSTRRLNAQLDNLSADLGALLIGPATDFIGFLSDVLGALDGPAGATGALAKMRDEVEKTGDAMADAAAGPVKSFAQVVNELEQAGRAAALGDILGHSNAELAKWIDGYTFVGKMLGNTPEQLIQIAAVYQKAGKTMEEYRADLIASLSEFGAEELAKGLGVSVDQANRLIQARLRAGAPDLQTALTDLWGGAIEGTLTDVITRVKVEDKLAETFSWGWWVKDTDDAVDSVVASVEEMGPLVTAELVKVQNKSGKGWKWKWDISHQLTDLRKQFKRDLHAMYHLLNHPEEGQRMRSELERSLTRAEKALQRAVSEKNMGAVQKGIDLVKDLKDQLASLDAKDWNATLYITAITGVTGAAAGGIHPRRSLDEPSRVPGRYMAEGGQVDAGMPYVVGEKRPELFVPESSGYILPSIPDRRIDLYVHDSDGGLARAGISTRQLAAAIASSADAQSRYEDSF